MKEKYIMYKTQSKNKTSSFLSLVSLSFPYSWPKFPLKTSHLQKHTIEKYLLDIRFEKINPAKINQVLINPLKVRYSYVLKLLSIKPQRHSKNTSPSG